jgi:hypothetical protein
LFFVLGDLSRRNASSNISRTGYRGRSRVSTFARFDAYRHWSDAENDRLILETELIKSPQIGGYTCGGQKARAWCEQFDINAEGTRFAMEPGMSAVDASGLQFMAGDVVPA